MVKSNIFSESLEDLGYEDIPQNIQEVLDQINLYYPNSNLRIKKFEEGLNKIAICLEVDVQIPSRGTVNGIDIREKEPIILIIDLDRFPYKAPSVYSDRKSFPSNQLPHLYPVTPGTPANLCLHRGNINDWFAENSIIQLIKRTQNWLRDAARNRLIRNQDEFEFTRITETKTVGFIIFEESKFLKWHKEMLEATDNKRDYGIARYILVSGTEEPLVNKNQYTITASDDNSYYLKDYHVPLIAEESFRINEKKRENDDSNLYLFGIHIYPDEAKVYDDYFAEIPDTWEGFVQWGQKLNLPIEESVNAFIQRGLLELGGLPITIHLPRPQKVINHESNIEFLNFVLNLNKYGFEGNGPDPRSPLSYLQSRSPLTTKFAKKLSGHEKNPSLGNILQIGCGAVGSKVIMNLAKSGEVNFTLVDNDTISPHNLVRNALLSKSVGKSKVEEIKNEIDNIFYSDDININTLKKTGFEINNDLYSDSDYLLDGTASESFHNFLIDKDLPENIKYCRFELYDLGNIGLLRIEGENRKPRMDDLQLLFFDLAIEDENLTNWLKSEQKRRTEIGSIKEEIFVGLSCNSDTMRISDEVVSTHSSLFSRGIRNYNNIGNGEGLIQYTVTKTDEFISLETNSKSIEAPLVQPFKNESNWQVRFNKNIKSKLIQELNEHKPDETGGILIGRVNNKRNIIYVTRYMPAPSDSKESPYAFVRGVENVTNEIQKIRKKTGGVLDYVGEWHTHPGGSPDLSTKDLDTVNELRGLLDKVPYPTFITIVTEDGLNPYIFGEYL